MNDTTPPPAGERPTPERSTRREVLGQVGLAAGLATVAGFWLEGFGQPLRRREVEATPRGAAPRNLTPAQFATLDAATARLLPGTGPADPGAREVNAAGYIDAVLGEAWFDVSEARRIRDGLDKLDLRAQREFERKDFPGLTAEQQDAAIRMFEAREGGIAWLRSTIGYVLEAFFGDPVHGINPDEIGWRWAGHVPGTPRPTEAGWRIQPR